MVYPYQSSKRTLKSAFSRGNRYINQRLTRKELAQLETIRKRAIAGYSTINSQMIGGRLKPTRRRFHKTVIQKQFKNKNTIDKQDPDLYIFGGLPASGKTTALAKKVPENTVVIDSDYYKQQLAKKTKSPMKKYPLAHAQYLHNEADLLVEAAVKKAIKEGRNVTYDATFKTYDKGAKVIERFKREGYDIHFLGTQKSPSKSISHAARRFIKSGRFVPLNYIRDYGNQISANSWKARKLGDTYQVYDTNTRKIKLITKSKKPMSHNFRDPK
jgi:predicted ABC-type ATPase